MSVCERERGRNASGHERTCDRSALKGGRNVEKRGKREREKSGQERIEENKRTQISVWFAQLPGFLVGVFTRTPWIDSCLASSLGGRGAGAGTTPIYLGKRVNSRFRLGIEGAAGRVEGEGWESEA